MTGLPGELVTNHLHIDLLTHVVPNGPHEVLVNPGLKLAHPVLQSAFATRALTTNVAWLEPCKEV